MSFTTQPTAGSSEIVSNLTEKFHFIRLVEGEGGKGYDASRLVMNRAIYVTVSHVSESLLAHYHLLHRILITNELKNGLLQGDQSSSLVILISSK